MVVGHKSKLTHVVKFLTNMKLVKNERNKAKAKIKELEELKAQFEDKSKLLAEEIKPLHKNLADKEE